MRKAGFYASWAVLILFLFIMGVGAAHSIWGGVMVIVLMAAMWGIFNLG